MKPANTRRSTPKASAVRKIDPTFMRLLTLSRTRHSPPATEVAYSPAGMRPSSSMVSFRSPAAWWQNVKKRVCEGPAKVATFGGSMGAQGGKAKKTPLMAQYQRIKEQHPDAVLLFVWRFLRDLRPDAVTASRVLGIVLTKRNNGAVEVELAGFPHHALDTYLPKLVRAGHRVAICDQLDDPKQTKTIVKRGHRGGHPGLSFHDQVVDHRANNWLAAVVGESGHAGVAFPDITTGEFLVGEGGREQVAKLLDGHAPAELLLPKDAKGGMVQELAVRPGGASPGRLGLHPGPGPRAAPAAVRHHQPEGLRDRGPGNGPARRRAILYYLEETRHQRAAHVNCIARLSSGRHVGSTLHGPEPGAGGPGERGCPHAAAGHGPLRHTDGLTAPAALAAVPAAGPGFHRRTAGPRGSAAEAWRLSCRTGHGARPHRRPGTPGRQGCRRTHTARELLQIGAGPAFIGCDPVLLTKSDKALAAAAGELDPPLGLADRIEATIEPDTPASCRKEGW